MSNEWTDAEIDILMRAKKQGFSYQSINKLIPEHSQDAIRSKYNSITPTQMRLEVKRLFVYGDVHYPYHDQNALEIALEVCRDFKPDIIVNNGDLLDFHEFSKFRDPQMRKPPSEREYGDAIDLAKSHLALLRKKHPNARLVFNPGNHDDRLFKYIADSAPALLEFEESYRALSLAELLRLNELKIEISPVVGSESQCDFGNLLVGHWLKYSKHSGFAAKHLLEEKGISLIQAHTHHMGAHYKSMVRREIVGYEGGCLCNLEPSYKLQANWQQGVVLVTFIGKYFSAELVNIVTTAEGLKFAIYGGKMYSRDI